MREKDGAGPILDKRPQMRRKEGAGLFYTRNHRCGQGRSRILFRQDTTDVVKDGAGSLLDKKPQMWSRTGMDLY